MGRRKFKKFVLCELSGRLFFAAVSESSSATLCLVQRVGELPFSLFVVGNDHLCYALAVVDGEGLVGEIDEDDADFAAIVGINGAWGIQNGDAVLDGQSATWAYLRLVACGQGDEESCGDQGTLQGLELDGSIEVCLEIHACRLWSSIGGQGVMGTIDDGYLHDFFRSFWAQRYIILGIESAEYNVFYTSLD